MLSAAESSDLIGRVEEQLGRFGIAGRVELAGTSLRLVGHGRTIVISFEDAEHWTTASPEQQNRILDRVVRELVRTRRAETQVQSSSSSWVEWLRPLVVLVVVLGGLAFSWKWLGAPARDALLSRSDPRESELAASTKAAHAVLSTPKPEEGSERCQRVQARVATGGSVGPLDVDGWVVELMLLSNDPTLGPASPRLDSFFAKRDQAGAMRRMAWAEDEALNALDSPDTFVVVSPEPLVDVVAGTRAGVRITWSGKYVGQYFDEQNRLRMQRLAAALYEATSADFAALYARCALGPHHQVGSWFRAKDLPSAALSMLAAMGLYAEVTHIEGADLRTTRQLEQRRVWDQLTERAAKLQRQELTMALSQDGGMLASRPRHWQTITFPFQDANRATRASLKVARLLGVAPRP